MKYLFCWLAVVCLVVFANGASADWAKDLLTDPPAGTVVPSTVPSGDKELFFYINNGDTTDSSWVFLSRGRVVKFCLNSDVTSVTKNANAVVVHVLAVDHRNNVAGNGTQPTDDLGGIHYGGYIFNGVASTGLETACVWNVWGPMWFKVTIETTPSTNDARFSVTNF